MRLINQTKNIVLADDVFIAKTFFSRAKGLLGRKTFLSNQVLILDPGNSVHTFFMQFAIDLIFVDQDYRIIQIVHNLRPNRLTPIYWRSNKVIEFPAGKLSAVNAQLKDQLQIL